MSDMVKINGPALKALRIAAKHKQHTLAAVAQCSVMTIKRAEAGDRIKSVTAAKIAKELAVHLGSFAHVPISPIASRITVSKTLSGIIPAESFLPGGNDTKGSKFAFDLSFDFDAPTDGHISMVECELFKWREMPMHPGMETRLPVTNLSPGFLRSSAHGLHIEGAPGIRINGAEVAIQPDCKSLAPPLRVQQGDSVSFSCTRLCLSDPDEAPSSYQENAAVECVVVFRGIEEAAPIDDRLVVRFGTGGLPKTIFHPGTGEERDLGHTL
jgi:DNA-binding XRE family transcriptional regulator